MVDVKRKKQHGTPVLVARLKGKSAFVEAQAQALAKIDKSLFLPFVLETPSKGAAELSFDLSRLTPFADWASGQRAAAEIRCLCRDIAWSIDACINNELPLKNAYFDVEALFYDSWRQAFRFVYLPVDGIEPDVSKAQAFVLDVLARLMPADAEALRLVSLLQAAVGDVAAQRDPLMVAAIMRRESLAQSACKSIASTACRPQHAETLSGDSATEGFPQVQERRQVDGPKHAQRAALADDLPEIEVPASAGEEDACAAASATQVRGTIVLGLMEEDETVEGPGTIVLGLDGDMSAAGFSVASDMPVNDEPVVDDTPADDALEGGSLFADDEVADNEAGSLAADAPDVAEESSCAAEVGAADDVEELSCAAGVDVLDSLTADGEEPIEDSEGATTLLCFDDAPVFELVRSKTGECIRLPEGRFVVGKSIHSDWRIAGNTTVSRLHAVFDVQGDRCWLEDSKSLNGTFLNGVKLASASRVELSPGDVVRLSDEDFLFKKTDAEEGR